MLKKPIVMTIRRNLTLLTSFKKLKNFTSNYQLWKNKRLSKQEITLSF